MLTRLTPNNALQPSPFSTDLYQRFIAYLDASPKTVATYQRALKQFFSFLKANHISQPEREDILDYRDTLKTRCKPTTVQSYMMAVRLFFGWTSQEQLYPNIADKIKGAKISREHKKDALTAEQVKQVLRSIDRTRLTGQRDYAMLALMLTAGLRTIEVARANIGDLGHVSGYSVLYIQGKGKEEKSEYVKLAEPIEKAIRVYLANRGQIASDSPLFSSVSNNSQGQQLTTRSISGLVKARFLRAGYDSERLTAHSLRHTAGTLNLLAGGSLDETQQLLRHSKLDTTMIYLHHLERAKNQSEARIAASIF